MGSRNWEVKIVDMEMDDVEFIADHMFENFVEHHKVMCNLIDATCVEPQGFRRPGNQSCRREGIATCEQSDVVTLLHEFFC